VAQAQWLVQLACRMGSNCSKPVKPDYCATDDVVVFKRVRSITTIGFMELEFDRDIEAQNWMTQSFFRSKLKNRDGLKMFLVETNEMAWYSGSLHGASPEQCRDPYLQEHLCVVACDQQHKCGGMIMHAQSRILCLPQIVTNRSPDRARLSWVLRQHSVLGKVVDKIQGCARREGQLAPCPDLAVQLAPCFEFAAPPESSNEREETVGDDDDDDDDELCIVCSHGKRNWKWGGCTHKTDGPSLICLQCRGALLRAEREAQHIVDDNRAWVETKCIICNQRSGFQRWNPRRKGERHLA
jgi:hypothetical protein